MVTAEDKMKTFIPRIDDIRANRKWYLVDLKGMTLGRAANKVAGILSGKGKPVFTPHIDAGDYVIATNASHLKVTGRKTENKKYYRYSGYPGGLKVATFTEKMAKSPTEVFEHAVKGMLPKNRLGRKMIKKLHVYADEKHRHDAQMPERVNLLELK
jgi:large subunit ribosomal protein L13